MLMTRSVVYFSKPGEFVEKKCSVCGAICDVKRNCFGPTSYASAMAGSHYLHDQFSCPYNGLDWHKLAILLIDQKRDCASPRVRKLIELDLQDTLKKRPK